MSWIPFARYAAVPAASGDLLAFRAQTAKILQNGDDDPHLAGIAALLNGAPSEGMALLEKHVAARPSDAAAWSDLAAARYEEGRSTKKPHLFAAALAAADQSLDLKPGSPEALFNRAIALDELGLTSDAALAYDEYLGVDASSPWAVEVRSRVRTASTPTTRAAWTAQLCALELAVLDGNVDYVGRMVRRFPHHARPWAENDYLARWGMAFLTGSIEEANHWLNVSRTIGDAIAIGFGEALLADAVRAIDSAAPPRKQALAEAHVAYRTARMLYHARRVSEAMPLLDATRLKLERAASPMALPAAYFFANALVDAHQTESAREIHDRLVKEVPARYRVLRAQMEWLRIMLFGMTEKPYEAVGACRSALEAFNSLGELESATHVRAMYGSMLALLGNDTEAWRLRASAFRDASAVGAANLVEKTIHGAARDAIADQQWEIARSLLRIELRRPPVSPRLRFDAVMSLATVEARLQNVAPDFAAAKTEAARIPDPSLRADAQDELKFAEAVHGRGDPHRAVALLSEVIDYRSRIDRRVFLASAYLERARAIRKLGDNAAAERDLRRTIGIVETIGVGIGSMEVRDAFFNSARDAYRDLTELLVDGRRFGEAFEIADRGRARVIAERTNPSGFSTEDLQRRLAEGTVVVHYTVLDARTVITIVERACSRTEIVPIGAQALGVLRNRFLRALERNDDVELSRMGTRLYRSLVAGAMRGRTPSTLVIVHDDATAGIPFAALRTPGGRSLIEESRVIVAPSAAAFCQQRHSKNAGDLVSIIADPAFDQTVFPHLKRLRAARDEAARLQGLFPNFAVLIGADATKANLMASLAASQFVHVASHGLSDRTDASMSLLALASSQQDNGILYSREIAALDLSHGPVVVMAGCRTGSSNAGDGSIRSLALAFLAAGSRSVVATLWDVDDSAASRITLDFYRAIKGGSTPAAALRAAQIRALGSGAGRTADWAAFEIFSTVE